MTDHQESFRVLMDITRRPAISFAKGDGDWLMDQGGNRYLDFIQGWAVNALGHCPTPVVNAIHRQAATLINCSPAYFNESALALAGLLVAHSCFDRVFFCNSGAEANEGAIKLARKWGGLHRDGAFEIITFDHAFHGRTLATMSASGKPHWQKLFEPKVAGFHKVPLNDLDAVRQACSAKTVAIMLEPIQGEAGVFPATDDFMRELRAFTRQEKLLLIVDEIQTGMGRTGRLFAYEHAGIEPDIMTLGKGMGGGVPLAALLCREDIACFEHGDQGGTFNGNSLMTAAGLAILEELLKPGFLEQVDAQGSYLRQALEKIAKEHDLGSVRGRGLLLALDLKKPIGAQIAEMALARNLLLNSPQPDSLRFMPALNVSRDSIDQMVTILAAILVELL
ncbi:MAG: acetylornithine transaminase [Magnetococcales bacterium]|nr:acetylornithine transaminase [Magnetococcales bacterium]MBF0321330.1 acetylornithine transaminase [Magnetococcales bacterium]